MVGKKKKEDKGGKGGIKEAIRTLVSLTTKEEELREGNFPFFELLQDEHSHSIEKVDWLKRENLEKNNKIVKETFNQILQHLESQSGNHVIDIIRLAKSAEKRWRGILKFFKKKKPILQETKKIALFYKKHVAKKIEEKALTSKIEELSEVKNLNISFTKKKIPDVSHIFIGLESVKQDKEYELFFIKKEDGSQFYRENFLKEVRLIQEVAYRKRGKVDFFEELERVKDCFFQKAAADILSSEKNAIERFCEEALQYKTRPSSKMVQMALMALTMASSKKNLAKEGNPKGCKGYFHDFHKFLRQLLRLQEYSKENSNSYVHAYYDLMNALCFAFFSKVQGFKVIYSYFIDKIQEGELLKSKEHLEALKKNRKIWGKLALDYEALKPLLKTHNGGPLKVTVELMKKKEGNFFDPLFQGDLPSFLYALHIKEKKSSHVRMAAPVHQEYIHKVHLIDEFEAFLAALNKGGLSQVHFMVNLQDKTSWKEFKRVQELEERGGKEGEIPVFEMISLAKETEFYHQEGKYSIEEGSEAFFESFREQLRDPRSGFYFPKKMEKALFPKWIKVLFKGILNLFFEGNKKLSKEERRDFIEIASLFIILKGVERTSPDSFSFVSKDGLDAAQGESLLFYGFLHLLKGDKTTNGVMHTLETILFAPSLLVRERLMLECCFQRTLSALKRIEESTCRPTFYKEAESLFNSLYLFKIKELSLQNLIQ